jgi:GxxExxY protein
MSQGVEIPQAWNLVTESVIGCAITVCRALGPGLAEVLYERAMDIELSERGISFTRQHRCTVTYKGRRIGDQVLDLVVDRLVVVELKSVAAVHDQHLAQLLGYMRAADLPLGLLLNFGALPFRDGIYRRIHPQSSHFQNTRLASGSSAPSAPLRTTP